jgi:hypothetical protein
LAKELSNYHSSLEEDDATMDRLHRARLITPSKYGHDELFSFSNVTDRDIFDAIRGIKSVVVGLTILPCITHMFNMVLIYSTFPET